MDNNPKNINLKTISNQNNAVISTKLDNSETVTKLKKHGNYKEKAEIVQILDDRDIRSTQEMQNNLVAQIDHLIKEDYLHKKEGNPEIHVEIKRNQGL